ncbi:MAG: Lrp/AsnC family transcriptional regulator [Ilumatobacteraceae bacterium]|nr:Lrp/AsnC family transcriptional regulator [Ilumatobacteraceae bacterium]MCU1388468.1 Lrp/AsnC family transcriptional regulator [Ilumatobacteraceae bacterium]
MADALDDLDRQILDLLRDDGRLSSRSIGRRLGVAAGTVGTRVRRLEQTGVIRGYRAVIEPAAVGRPLGFVVGLQIAQGTPLGGILDELVETPEIDEVLVVTGRWDLLVIGRVADPSQLNDLLTKGLWQSPSFRHSETMVVIDDRRASAF